MKDLKFIKTVTVTTLIEKYDFQGELIYPIETVDVTKTELINWEIIPVGSKYTAIIDGEECEGRIQKDRGFIYLCQNIKSGTSTKNKLGYKYTWELDKNQTIEYFDVHNLKIELDPDFMDNYVEPEVFIVGEYEAMVHNGFVKVGCQTITNEQIKKLYNNLKEA